MEMNLAEPWLFYAARCTLEINQDGFVCTTLLLHMNIYVCSVPVQVSNGDDLSSDIVVESVDRAGVNEAVSHPKPGLYHLLDLSQHLTMTNTKEMIIESIKL